MKRITTVLLTLCICLSLFTAPVSAAKKNLCDTFQDFLETMYNGPGEFETVEQKLRFVFELLATDEYKREAPAEGEKEPYGDYAIPASVLLKKAVSLFDVSSKDLRSFRLPENPTDGQIYYDAENDLFCGDKAGTTTENTIQIVGYTVGEDKQYVAYAFMYDKKDGYASEEKALENANGKNVHKAGSRYYTVDEYLKVTLYYNGARARFVKHTDVVKLPPDNELITVGEGVNSYTWLWILVGVVGVAFIGSVVYFFYKKQNPKKHSKKK